MMANEIEKPEDIGTDQQAKVTRWLREIDLASRHEKNWRERSDKIVKRYRDDDRPTGDDVETKKRFNILYANTEVLKGVMYQKTPTPDVRRRFLDRDPIARQAAQILQRALSYTLDAYDFDGTMRQVVEDVLLPGRGMACVKYVPTMGKVDVPQADGSVGQEERKVYEEVTCDYKEWKWIRISPAPSWNKVRWVAFGELMTREELVAAFGDKGKRCALDWKPADKEREDDELFKRALVWAIWDKKSRTVIFVSKGLPEMPLNEVSDPLGLEGFLPCPKPVYSVCTNGDMVPVPEYLQYQDQAQELDAITERIDRLIDGLKYRGIYDAALKSMERLRTAGDNEFLPVEEAARFYEGGGFKNAIWEQPIETISKVLAALYLQRDQVKQVIYEVTGIADIVRGSTNASETLGAQELKARYANVRIGPRQKLIEHFARDILRLKAEIIAEKFDVQTLKLMTGAEMWMVEVKGQKVDATEQIMALLKSDKLRGFRVDVETDSTIQPDATDEQKNRVEFVTGVGQFVTAMAPAVQSGAVPMEVARELLSFAARGFKLSPQLEDALDKLGGEQTQAVKQEQDMQRKTMADLEMRDKAADVAKKEAEARKIDNEGAGLKVQNDATSSQAQAQTDMVTQTGMLLQGHAQMMGEMMQQSQQMMAQMMGQFTQALQSIAQSQQQMAAGQQQLAMLLTAPKETQLLRDEQGRPIGAVSRPVTVN